MFSDESRFAFRDGRKRIWRRVGEQLELSMIDMEEGLLWYGVELP